MAKKGFCQWPINELRPGKNSRKFFPDLESLADQIAESGWVQTLQVKPDGEIIAGERRFRACQILHKRDGSWSKLPCIVIDADDNEAFDLNALENLGRAELRFIELARIFQSYREVYGKSNEEIGKACGFRAETVSRYISILEKCHPDIITRLENGDEIPPHVLINVHRISDKEVQKVRLEQWLGTAPVTASEVKPSKQRVSKLSRRKMLQVVQLLQEVATEETIQVAQYLAGLRQTLPNKWHLRLSQTRRPPVTALPK